MGIGSLMVFVTALFFVVALVAGLKPADAAAGEKPDTGARAGSPEAGPGYTVKIPVLFYPPGSRGHLKGGEEGTFEVPADAVALVLVDTWNGGDPAEGEEPSQSLKNRRAFLDRCREYGVTVIHAPNHPVVDKYPQYHAIKETVEAFMADYPPAAEVPPFLNWPPRDNEASVRARQLRKDAEVVTPELARNIRERDISRLLTPLDDEYVLASHNEFRYVLWERKIKLLLYMGGALNECMQHRDTGINLLAGSDSRRTAFAIVVLEDCSSAMATPCFDSEVIGGVMLDYFMTKIAFVANSKEIEFIPASE